MRVIQISAFACQGGQGTEKALEELKKCIGIDSFAQEAVFIDPKASQTEETDRSIEAFAGLLK